MTLTSGLPASALRPNDDGDLSLIEDACAQVDVKLIYLNGHPCPSLPKKSCPGEALPALDGRNVQILQITLRAATIVGFR